MSEARESHVSFFEGEGVAELPLDVQATVLAELRNTTVQQTNLFTALGTRAINLMSVIAGTTAAAIAIERAVSPKIPTWGLYSIIADVVAVVIASLIVILTIEASTVFNIGEDPESMQARAGGAKEFRVWLIREYSEMVRDNRVALKERAVRFEIAFILLLGANILLLMTATLLYVSAVYGL